MGKEEERRRKKRHTRCRKEEDMRPEETVGEVAKGTKGMRVEVTVSAGQSVPLPTVQMGYYS